MKSWFGTGEPIRRSLALPLLAGGYAFVVMLIWLDEAVDLPHLLLGATARPPLWEGPLLRTIVITVVALLLGGILLRMVRARRAAHAEARRLATHYQVVADHTYDWEFWVGTNGRFTYSSPSCERITGHPPEEFAADPRLLRNIIHPEDLDAYREHRSRSHREHVPGEMRFRIIRPDGEVRWIGHVCQPVFGAEGELLGVRGSNRDITQVREAEVAIESIAEHLRRAQQVARVGSWELDLRTGRLFWSEQVYRIFGVEGGTPLDYETFLETVHEEDREALDKSWREALKGGVYDIEHRIRVNGEIRWVRETAEVEFDAERTATRGIGIVQDVTARRRAEEEVDRLDAELSHVTRIATMGEFSAALAHELNQPLAAILTNAQAALRFLRRDEPDLLEVEEILGDIAEDDKRARDVILKLRELTKKPLERRSPEPLAVNPLVTGVLKIVRGDLSLRGVELRTELEEDLPPVSANGVQIQQALLNLILNALEAMDSGDVKRLRLTTERADSGAVEISVTDTGPGFGIEDPSSVFLPFVTTKEEGMGMGLAISRAAVETHGGSLRAENAPEGGARLVIALPAAGEGP